MREKLTPADRLWRMFYGLILAGIAFCAVRTYPYFSEASIPVFAVFVFLIGCLSPRAAVLAVAAAFGVTLAYHGYSTFLLYGACFAVIVLLLRGGPAIVPTFIVIAGAACLAALPVGPGIVPLEFIVVAVAPLILERYIAAGALYMAYLWCVFYGIVNNREFVGNLPIGSSKYTFLIDRPAPGSLTDFSWLHDKSAVFDPDNIVMVSTAMIQHIFSHPMLLVQAFLWAMAGMGMAFLLERHKLWMNAAAAVLGLILVLAGQTLVAASYAPKSNLGLFVTTACVVFGAAFLLFQISDFLVSHFHWLVPMTKGQSYSAPREHKKPVIRSVSGPLPGPAQDRRVEEFLRQTKPSLEDSIRIQKHISDYIKQRFVHEATALAIDVVGSTALKSGAGDEDVISSFTEYWRFVDGAIMGREGRLLNRAGDGALYVFKYADPAVIAAREVFKCLDRFNKKGNLLKNAFQVRIGLDTGTIVEQGSGIGRDVFSRVLDLAAHMEELAPVGGLLISENTYAKLSKTKNDFVAHGRSERDGVDMYVLKV